MMPNYKLVKADERMLSYWYKYNNYNGRTLNQCYKKPSAHKKYAWNHWCKVTSAYNTAPTILCYNCMYYTVGFVAEGYLVVVKSNQILVTKVEEFQELQVF